MLTLAHSQPMSLARFSRAAQGDGAYRLAFDAREWKSAPADGLVSLTLQSAFTDIPSWIRANLKRLFFAASRKLVDTCCAWALACTQSYGQLLRREIASHWAD